MIRYEEYIVGWIGGSIHDLLEILPRNSAQMKYALITSLDSETDIRSLVKASGELKALSEEGQFLGQGLLVPTRRLLELESRNRIFFGFDEVLFFPTDQIQPKPDSAWLVGPGRMTQEGINTLGQWMVKTSCSLALGDGVGLNFVVKAQGLVKHLLAFSLDQPEPTLRHTFEEEPWNPELTELL